MTGLRMLVGAWCIFCWLVGSMLGVFALDACDYTDPATCDRAMNTDLPIFTAAQLLVLVVALVFSSPRRRPRTHAIALTLGGIAPVVLNVLIYLVGYYTGRGP